MLKGKSIYLRSVEPSDATRLMLWENNPEHWRVTDTEVPFSMQGILQLIEQQQHIRSTGMLRLMICLNESEESVGAIDLYDADFRHSRAAVGILIGENQFRNKGYATEAMELIVEYAKKLLSLENLYASVQADNQESLALFHKCGFEEVGRRRNWFLHNKVRIDEVMFQKCLNEK
jgi:diamine N-acetyltransferase